MQDILGEQTSKTTEEKAYCMTFVLWVCYEAV